MSYDGQQYLGMMTRPVRILVFIIFILASCLIGFFVSSLDINVNLLIAASVIPILFLVSRIVVNWRWGVASGEPFGRVVMEAQSFGIPVIGTRSGGIPEILDKRLGGLVDVGNIGQLAAAIDTVLGGTI